MPPKRSSLGRVDPNTKRVREVRANETLEQREARLEENRLRNAESRAAETSEQREARLEQNRSRVADLRAAETSEQRETRTEENRLRTAESRAAETSVQNAIRLETTRLRNYMTRAAETPEQREVRNEQNRLRTAETRALETSEQHETRNEQNRIRTAESRALETSDQRQDRNEGDRLRTAESRLMETSEQRENRLEGNRPRVAESRAAESSEQREIRLAVTRSRNAELRAIETPQQLEFRRENDRRRHIQSRQLSNRSDLRLKAFNYDPHCDYRAHPRVSIGKMDVVCGYCHARRYRAEPPGMCCSNGKVRLPDLNQPPEPLRSYMSGTTAESKHFLQNIRKYNSCFQMTSFGTTAVVQEAGFMPTFKIQGQIYHRTGSLLPPPNEDPRFLQIYFVADEEKQADRRCETIDGTRRNIVLNLQRMLHQHNNLVNVFKTALDKMPTDEYKVVIRADKRPQGEHERRFNAPTVNEVAVIMVGDEFERRDIVIQRRSEALQRISETHRSYDALQYPLMFWEGEDGYHFNIMRIDPTTGCQLNRKVSAMDFYAYRIMIRNTSPNHILNCRLFHQFIVDMYAKIESERLLYIRLNQKKLRVEEYIHLRDAVVNDGSVSDIGRTVILPATFTGSPRHMHEYAQDAMFYVRTCGRPDLFITFTCNPEWIEIKEELMNGQVPSDRHDLIARVFKQKLTKLMDVITKSHVYGETRCWLYSVEWQKRGLSHAHILIWLREKIRPTQIDNIISAELPNPEEDPRLFEIIAKNMIHGPCGPLNPNSPCMKEGKCTKKYPREFLHETQTGNDGYPLYKRRRPGEGGYTAITKLRMNNQPIEIEIDNRRKQGDPVPGYDIRASDALGRVYTVHPNNDECYYLRLLLHTVRGPTSFVDLKTVDGEVCETFKEACQKLGLLEDDQHWDATLSEACLTCFPSQLRNLFAIIITSCAPSNPQSLWEKYKESISEDILREQCRANPTIALGFSSEIFNQALIMIEDRCLLMSGKTLLELGLQAPARSVADVVNSEILRERNYNVDQLESFVQANKPLLVNDQRLAFDAVMNSVRNGDGGLFFLDAPGGIGKTFLINLLLAEIRKNNDIALAIASSGIASTLLDGGRTAHSALKLPLDLTRSETPVCNISRGSGKAQLLKLCKLIVWDECTMAHKRALEALDRTLQDIRGSSRLMGGVVVVLAGGFRQTLPVIPRSTPADELNACLKASYLWRNVQKMTLNTNMRVHLRGDDNAQSFAEQLLRLGDGKIPVDPETDLISFPSNFCNVVASLEELVNNVFPDIRENFTNHQWLCDRAVLAPMNESVNYMNMQIQDQLPGPITTYESIDTVVDSEQAVNYPTEFLNSLEPPGMPPHKLSLKVGSPIMLLRNIDPPKLCNGTRLCVKNFCLT
ncbi:hypothetical protein Y032_0254g286 [Ancylostoma ceylanicum]|uniref:ATP-dependent DNA helicase n=1 Tax=Ancylostoma ceylanicum TaxID=53326 RepID=A0A016SC70_9BILA|nr:hypothetical protein Y032_0254g286 [Ancylostoma ceylanicum]